MDRAAYDLRPLANVQITNAGSVPGSSTGGLNLKAAYSYQHTALASARPVLGGITDIGAYEVK